MSFSVPARRGGCAISFCTLGGISIDAAATDASCAALVSRRRRVNGGVVDIRRFSFAYPFRCRSRAYERSRRQSASRAGGWGFSDLVRRNPCRSNQALFRRPAGQRRPLDAELFQIRRSEEQTSELQSLMRISYAVFCL